MQFINKIETIEELKAFKKQLGKTIERKLGSPLGERKLNETTADFLGVRDYNTAMGIISLRNDCKRDISFFEEVEKNAHKPKKEKATDTPLMVRAWVFLLNQIVVKNLLNEEEIQIILDEFIFDFFGDSKRISDNINNQGWQAQINAIINTGYINEFTNELEDRSNLSFNNIAFIFESIDYLKQHPEQDEYEQKNILDLNGI